MKSATNGINAMTNESPAFTESVGRLINAVIEPWQGGNKDAPVTITQPTPQFTSTPMPPPPTPSTDFNATATAYFGDFPTALPAEPTATPLPPMIDPAFTIMPTRFICNSVEDIQAGCTPPTPIPGN
jgi:hypothetical protein